MKMSRDQVAKNLLADKTCNTCVCGFVDECSFAAKIGEKRLKSKDNTCQHWQKREWPDLGIGKIILPIVRKTFPTLIAGKIASEWPLEWPTKIRKKRKNEN